jgi:hypothetical protein
MLNEFSMLGRFLCCWSAFHGNLLIGKVWRWIDDVVEHAEVIFYGVLMFLVIGALMFGAMFLWESVGEGLEEFESLDCFWEGLG